MKSKARFLVTAALLLLPMTYTNCTGVPAPGQKSSTLGNPFTTQAATQILSAACSVISRCHPTVSIPACLSGVRSTSGIGDRLGSLTSTFATYAKILDAESIGSIVANPVSATKCLSDLTELACTEASVVGAYVPTAPEPYAGVREMMDQWQYSCAGVFTGNNILFADGFESGDGGALDFAETTSSYPNSSSVPGGCHTGSFCGAQNLIGNSDQEAYWKKFVYYLPDQSYVRAYFKFPADWQFSLNGDRYFSAIQLSWGDCASGVDVGFRSRGGDGRSADLYSYSTATPGNVHLGSNFVPDGLWHSIEVYSSPSQQNVKVWFDSNLVIDAIDPAGSCDAGEVRFGPDIVSNGQLPKDESFYVDDIVISRLPIGP